MLTDYKYPIFINLTQHCNLSCSYCFTNSSPNQIKESFVTRNWEDLLQQFIELKVPEIRFGGGEPLLFKNIKSICSSVYSNNIRYTITTNGKLVKKSINWLSKMQPSTIWLSYHKEYFTPKEYENILQICSKDIETIGVNIFIEDIVTNDELKTIIKNSSIKRVKILYKTKIGRNKESINSNNVSFNKVSSFLKEIASKGIEVRVEAPLYPNALKGKESCSLNTRPLLTINFDGSVTECCVLSSNTAFPLGYLNEIRFENIIKRYRMKKYDVLPCSKIFNKIEEGMSSCPLCLINI